VNMLIPPATPNGEVLLRYSVSAAHEPGDIDAALAIIAETALRTGIVRPPQRT
jgi:8-amino-7-oxononanoate synthase